MTTSPRTEKERMLSGAPYNPRDPELLARNQLARAWLAEYAALPGKDGVGRRAILQRLLGEFGAGAWLEAPFFCDYGENIFVGADVFINFNCVFLDSNPIRIGAGALIGPGVHIYTATHPVDAAERILSPAARAALGPDAPAYATSARPVTVGARAWIGGQAIVLPGVEIGENTVIGAGSVVTRSIPANCTAAGNPCRILRYADGR